MPLVALMYVSAAMVAWGTPIFDRIRRSSAHHNERLGITGLLLYSSGSFLQLIEGEERAVINTFNRIERDPRHTDITVVDWQFIVDRRFGQWGMATRRLGESEVAAHPHLAPYFEGGFDARALAARPEIAAEILAVAARDEGVGSARREP